MGCELVAIYPDIHNLCPWGFTVCKSRKLAAGIFDHRKNLDLLDLIRAPDYPTVAALCTAH